MKSKKNKIFLKSLPFFSSVFFIFLKYYTKTTATITVSFRLLADNDNTIITYHQCCKKYCFLVLSLQKVRRTTPLISIFKKIALSIKKKRTITNVQKDQKGDVDFFFFKAIIRQETAINRYNVIFAQHIFNCSPTYFLQQSLCDRKLNREHEKKRKKN